MKLNKILTDGIQSAVVGKTKSTKKVAEQVAREIESSEITNRVSPARLHLEMHAESMSPEEYIAARSYIADLEMSEFIASEMKTIK